LQGIFHILLRPNHSVQSEALARRRVSYLSIQARSKVPPGRRESDAERRTAAADTVAESGATRLGTTAADGRTAAVSAAAGDTAVQVRRRRTRRRSMKG
jgi:hypothetical protein